VYPDFLCIGAQKAGTTWLHATLSRHPEIWMPPVKEVDFWFHARTRPSPFSIAFYDARWKRQIARRLRARPELGLRELAWDANYFFRHRSLEWYQRVFEPGRGKRTGDATPAYARLSDADVALVRSVMPKGRIIYLLRDPIDRAWPGARMWSDRSGRSLAERDWRAYFDLQKRGHGDYLGTLRKWRAHFPPEQFFVGFMEEIEREPAELLLRLQRFLGVTASPEFVPKNSREKHNASTEAQLPAELERHLARLYLDDLGVLEREFGPRVEPWRRRAERALAGSA